MLSQYLSVGAEEKNTKISVVVVPMKFQSTTASGERNIQEKLLMLHRYFV